ncbi:Rid family detoxifying hydrolase [Acetanaerobacterium elongatum]|uniref:2-iminobutanoate/2-iminopropanoate deaminase n=1 Tax=Acetanaerobacterium elongatum TaxID=258515 RepID=A0A1G9XWH1_9FIRM|nr:Rid family detoxifying hydrolase [Acetanaerobacterium elongatum]SDN00831.1 2-iminobutanoate/2-iminopropanoate deaminase [Acetanaerobacterium elongatum]
MTEKKQVFTEAAPKPIGPYSQAVKAGGALYVSGQLGVDRTTGELAPDVREQAALALKNLGAILESEKLSCSSVVKTTVFLASLEDFAAVNEVYASFFTGSTPPARSCVQVSKLPKGALVEIEAVAVY